jgi:hypothetical protein
MKRENEEQILKEPDGHYCYDWDELAISALTPEYDCCVCFKKSLYGRIRHWLFMLWFDWQETKVRARENARRVGW